MANNVFANDLEIACKAADGKSTAAFPDPCWSPPDPTKVVIPYANTAYAKDTSNGSKTVYISGKEVMKKDVSYFKSSTGNEAADGGKGFSTGVETGKAYFTSWSMNVMIEGENVDRHTDGMTHNHGSKPSNSPIWRYADTSIFTADCKAEKKRMEKACAKDEKRPRYNKNWKKDNCKFLSFKPSKAGIKGLENPSALLESLKSEVLETQIMQVVADKAMDAATDIAFKMAVKLGAKFVATKAVPVAGWIYSAFTAAEDFAEASYYKEMYDGAQAEYSRITDSVTNMRGEIDEVISALEKTPPDLDKVGEKLADWQRSAATANDCLRARKCMLVEMAETDEQSGGMDSHKGCCPGQTGHHIIPDAFVKNAGCKGYKYKGAPVVCAEGQGQTHGSHGAIHTATTEMVVPSDKIQNELPTSKSYEEVRDGVIKAHAKTFPFSTCSRSCLKEQLDNYYKGCDDLTVSSKGMGVKPGNDTSIPADGPMG